MDEFLLELLAKLNTTESQKNIEGDIDEIQKQLKKHIQLKAEIDTESLTNIVKKIEKLTGQTITIPDIAINQQQVTKTAQQTGQKIGETVKKSVQQSLSLDDVIDKQVTDLMAKYSIAGKKGSKAFNEIRQAVVDYRQELIKANSADIDPDDIFSIIENSADINKVTSALANHIREVDATKEAYAGLAEYIKQVNNSGTKIHLPESIRQEYGDDFSSMRSQLGKAFTTGKGGDFETFIVELNGQLGNVIDLSQGAEAAFGDLVQKVNSAKGGNFLSGNELFSQGLIDRNEIERDITSAIDIIEEEEKKLAQASTATTNTVVQNEEKKQQAYQQTAKIQSSANNPDLDLSGNTQKIEQFKESLAELSTVDSKYVDKLSERFGELGIQIQSINASLSEVAVHENGEYAGTNEILSTTLKGIDKYGQAITLTESWNQTNHEFVKSLDAVGSSFQDVQKHVTTYQTKLNDLKTKYSNASVDYSGFEKVLDDFQKGIGTVDDLKLAFNELENSAKLGVQSLKSQSSSFDPIQQALNNMRDMPSMLKTLEASMNGVKDKTSLAGISVKDLTDKYNSLQAEMAQNDGKVPLTEQWTSDYRELMSTVTSATKQVEALKKAEASDNSQATKQANYYSTLLSNYKEIYSLKKKLITAGEEETKIIKEQIRSLSSSNASIYGQLDRQGLKDSSCESHVNDLKESLDYSLRISEAHQKDKTVQSNLNDSQKESIQIVKELEQAYQRIQDIKVKISSLDNEKDGEKISTLSQEEKTAQDEYNQLYNKLRKRKNYDKESWNETKVAIDAATKSQIEYNQANKQDKLNSAVKSEVDNLTNLKSKWEEQGILVGEFKDKVDQLETSLSSVGSKDKLDELKSQLESLKTEAATIVKADKIQLSLDTGEYESKVRNLIARTQQWTDENGNARISTNNLEKALDDLVDAQNELAKSGTVENQQNLINKEKQLEIQIKATTSDIRTMNAELAKSSAIDSLHNQVADFMSKNGKTMKYFGKDLNDIFNQTVRGANLSKKELADLKQRWADLQIEARNMGVLGKTAFQTLREGISSFTSWVSATTIVMSAFRSLRTAIENVRELDDDLLELSKVSDLSAEGLAKVTDEAYKLGAQVGKTGTQVINAVTAFKRAGFDLEQSMQLAENALKMTNVAEGINDASESAQYLISIMKGYQDTSNEFSNKILDSINEVSNTQAVDFDNLADGAQRLSAVANQAGVSFDQMLGVLTGGYEVLGNMEKTASGLITIFTRLQSIQLADEEDVESIAKLQESFSSATKGVVNIVDQTTGQLRSAYDILNDLNKVWDTLDKNTQEGLAFAAGGTRQKSVFLSIMSNWESVEKSVQSATDSMGSAAIENEKYLDSISGKVSQFESAVEQLSATVVDSDLVKFFVDLGTTGVKAIDGIVNALTPLGTLAAGAGLFAGFKNVGGCENAHSHCFELPTIICVL